MNRSGTLILVLALLMGMLLRAEEMTTQPAKAYAQRKSVADSKEKKARYLCMENIIKISKAVYLYNFDSSPRLTDLLNGDVCDPNGFLVKREGLPFPILPPDKRCYYRSKGDLTSGGIIICDFHGENPEALKMELDGLAEAPIIDGEQVAISPKKVDLETPLLPARIRVQPKSSDLSTATLHLKHSSKQWRPKWQAEANNHSPSDAKTIIIRGKYYRAIQAPVIIPPESVEEHNRMLLRKKLNEQGYFGFPPMINRFFTD